MKVKDVVTVLIQDIYFSMSNEAITSNQKKAIEKRNYMARILHESNFDREVCIEKFKQKFEVSRNKALKYYVEMWEAVEGAKGVGARQQKFLNIIEDALESSLESAKERDYWDNFLKVAKLYKSCIVGSHNKTVNHYSQTNIVDQNALSAVKKTFDSGKYGNADPIIETIVE